MKFIRKITALGFVLLMSSVAFAQASDSQCMKEWKRGQTLATNQLWEKFEEKTQWLIKNCADEMEYTTLYADLAEAQGEQRKYKQSLNSAEKCLKLDTTAPECSYRKILALQKVGNPSDVDKAKQDLVMACKIVPKADMAKTAGCNRVLRAVQ